MAKSNRPLFSVVLLAAGASLHMCMSPHGPDSATFAAASTADLRPAKLPDDTLAFMFEASRPRKRACQNTVDGLLSLSRAELLAFGSQCRVQERLLGHWV